VTDPGLVLGKLEGIGYDAVVAGPGSIGITLAVVMVGKSSTSLVRNVDLNRPCAEVFVRVKANTLDRMETVESAPLREPRVVAVFARAIECLYLTWCWVRLASRSTGTLSTRSVGTLARTRDERDAWPSLEDHKTASK